MKKNSQTISIGFTQEKFAPGVHICQIFSDDLERQESLLHFILSGLQTRERVSCFSNKTTDQAIGEFLALYGLDYRKAKDCGAFALSDTSDVYFKDHRFDPDQMISLLRDYYTESMDLGYPAVRVIGEMTPEVQHLRGGERLMEYESRITMLQREHPFTAVCQYDARSFDGAMIMDILKVHPLMVVRGSVVHNPFYIQPEEFLNS